MCSVFIKHSSTFHIQLCNVASLVVQEVSGSIAWTVSYFSRQKTKRKGSLLCLLSGFTQTILNNNNNIAIGLLICKNSHWVQNRKNKTLSYRPFIISTKRHWLQNQKHILSGQKIKKIIAHLPTLLPTPRPMQGYSLLSRCGRLESETCWRAKGRRSPPE